MMPTNRRAFLHTLAAAGLALSGTGQAQASAAHAANPTATALAPEVLAITSAPHTQPLDAAFVRGVQAAASHVQHRQLQGLDSANFQQLSHLLHDPQETLLIGLLDDASATLVLDLVRTAGGRVLSETHHRIDPNATEWALQLGQSMVHAPASALDVPGTESRVALRCLI